jgi:hypothetical protein
MNTSPNLWKQDGQAYRAELRENRAALNSYYEKLALLNGATVALVVTAVLGPFHGKINHRHFLLAALTVQVLALLALLYRNLRAVRYEQASAAAWHGEDRNRNEDIVVLNELLGKRQWLESLGHWLTFLGMLLLVINAWLIFW